MIRWLAFFCVAVALAMMTIGSLAIRISHPDLSETRLMLNYWWYWALCLKFMSVALFLLRRVDSDHRRS